MYIIEIKSKQNSKLPDGPTYWAGSGEDFPSLAEGLKAAKEWIGKSYMPEDYEVKYRIVGCL